jgi:hypothetical protein
MLDCLTAPQIPIQLRGKLVRRILLSLAILFALGTSALAQEEAAKQAPQVRVPAATLKQLEEAEDRVIEARQEEAREKAEFEARAAARVALEQNLQVLVLRALMAAGVTDPDAQISPVPSDSVTPVEGPKK